MRKGIYLLAYLVPALVALSLALRGPWAWLAVLALFGVVPLLEQFLPGSPRNHDPGVENALREDQAYDWLLYLNLPIQYALMGYYLLIWKQESPGLLEGVGMVLAMGTACGALGINVAHELGHRPKRYEQRIAQGLLLSSLYLHFFIEHNRGHHRYVATPLDPATARRGESVYAFWLRSIRDSFRSAWQIEAERLRKAGLPLWSLRHNQMLRFQVLQLGLVLLLLAWGGWQVCLAFVAAALTGILMLETINYLEHYGLLRRELRPGVYERVQPRHSWNSDRSIGRILLYELTRHSDHHYLASRKYQTLRHFDESPELPQGYPGMMLLALFPPLWFRVMHARLADFEARAGEAAG